MYSDLFTRPKLTHEPVVDTAEQLLLIVREADDRVLQEAVEVVDDARVLEFIDLVENDDGSQATVVLKPVNELIWSVDCQRMSIVAPRSSAITPERVVRYLK